MKTKILLIFVFRIQFIYSQTPCENYCIYFDSPQCLGQAVIDTSLQQNIWQIGKSHKSSFTNPNSGATAIITDTLNSYPANNTSVFVIKNAVDMGIIYGLEMFSGFYRVQTDSLRDFGRIEFSPNNGSTWIDIINDSIHSANFIWYTPKPVLTGDKIANFEVLLADIGSAFNLHSGDTVQFRFTFTSDSTADNLGGLMYDNICFQSFVEGISEVHFKSIKSKIYPNPTTGVFAIEFDNPEHELFHLAIYSIHSKLLFTNDKISENRVVVDAQLFISGTYVYKLTSPKSLKRSWGKFIIAH